VARSVGCPLPDRAQPVNCGALRRLAPKHGPVDCSGATAPARRPGTSGFAHREGGRPVAEFFREVVQLIEEL